jgi:hypothetical protein
MLFIENAWHEKTSKSNGFGHCKGFSKVYAPKI